MTSASAYVIDIHSDYAILDPLLHQLTLATASNSGADFLESLVKYTAEFLNAEHVFITEVIDEDYTRARSVAYWYKGALTDNFEYDLEGFPCIKVVRGEIHYYPNNVYVLYPKEKGKESYLGVPLAGSKGQMLGHMVVLAENPTEYSPNVISALRICAARAATELERIRTEQALLLSQAQFRLFFENVPLGVVICTADEGQILHFNGSMRAFINARSLSDTILSSVLHPDDAPLLDAALQRISSETSDYEQLEAVLIRSDLSPVYCELLLFEATVGQENKHVLIFIKDISERKQLENERQRLARDLHDAVSQTLWSASLLADIIPDLWEKNPELARERLQQLRQLSRTAHAEMRALLLDLQPVALAGKSMPDILQHLVEAAQQRTYTKIHLAITGEVFIADPQATITLYRIIQEALNNIIRHAQAKTAHIDIAATTDKITIKIQDDGHGFQVDQPSGEHFGLKIMRERAQSIGAQFHIRSTTGEGTSIILIYDRGVHHDRGTSR